jgi:WD40 repeat protein
VKVILDAAEAFHHVHGLQILHRDLKPSNLMVDTAGQCWIIDFGLAAYQQESARSTGLAEAARSEDLSEHIRRRLTMAEGHGPGTPAYMAPEQWRREAGDPRTDVWGLGVTLYEMLALRPAFTGQNHDEIRHKVDTEEPPSPHEFINGVPGDLEAICRKALKKDPAARYQTAQELAGDLRRWLNHEPVTARRTRVPRRVWLWARRNRGWATALIVFCAACVVAAAGAISSAQNRAAYAEAEDREQQRESLLQQMQNVRLLPHQVLPANHWLHDGWDRVRRAAEIRKDDVLRDQAAAFLSDIDARIAKTIYDIDASSVAFDAEGRRLLIGGSVKYEAGIWDSQTDETQKLGLTGAGPVTFRPDGTALQLVATGANRFPLLLRNLSNRSVIRELRVSNASPGGSVGDFSVSHIEMTPDGKVAAAAATTKSGAEVCIVWDAESGKVVRQIQQSGRHITALAVSADGGFLALGDAEGQVDVWSLPEGAPFVLPAASPTRLNCLAFGLHVHSPVSRGRADKWLLAGGDAGGSVTIWDLGRKAAVTFCRGSYYDVNALAFSPDGVTLASTGRSRIMLWDIATGRLLLQPYPGDYMTGLAFSRDGRKLAVSMTPSENPASPPKAGVVVWELEPHRGVQTLRGLSSQIAHTAICFSHDGNKIAAVSVDWRVGIWDLPSGTMRYRLDMAPGLTADNTGLAFSPNGQKFAAAAGSQAKLWDLKSGQETTWQLPEGLLDTLVFDATGTRLFLFRMETSDWSRAPDGSSSYRQFPRVCRVRELLAAPGRDLRRPGKNNPTWETDFFNRRAFQLEATADGRYFVASGSHESAPDKPELQLKVFECATGKEVLSLPSERFLLGPTDNLLVASQLSGPHPRPQILFEIPTGKWAGSVGSATAAIGPGGRLTVVAVTSGRGFTLYRRSEETPLVTLGIDTVDSGGAAFSPDGTRLAWGTQDGIVIVCYLPEIQRRLSDIGFGW